MVRARVRQRFVIRRRGRAGVKTRMVRRAIARRPFRLTGGRSQTFRLPLNSRGQQLTAGPARPWSQLVVAIPGGRLTEAIRLR